MVHSRQWGWKSGKRGEYVPTLHTEYRKLAIAPFRNMRTTEVFLKKHHFYHKTSIKRDERTAELIRRAERGLLSYEGCRIQELRTFARNRHIDLQLSLLNKKELVQVLEEADEAATFRRFLDLPPELRTHIYTLHFLSFEILDSPAPPPIAQVSRLVRNEALPLFYRVCTFEVELRAVVAPDEDDFALHRPRGQFLAKTEKSNIRSMQRFRIQSDILDAQGEFVDILYGV